MEAAQAKLRQKIPKSKKDLKPNRTHAFHGVIWFLGWLLPPLAVLVRFGIGWDLLLNIILTCCGYIPGHGHKCYIQNVRNNKTKNRTPRWAVRAGLVKIKDPRAGRHQWAYRYDERVAGAPSAYNDGDADSIRRDSWDGRGPEPEHLQRSQHAKNGNQRHRFSPFADIVDDSEVEGEPRDGLYRSRSNLEPPSPRAQQQPVADPLTDEQFYEQRNEVPPDGFRKPQNKKLGSGLLKNRSRYEQPFDTTGLQASRTRSRTHDDEYQDDFEREINGGGPVAPPVGAGAGAGAGAGGGRFDSFEPEGPEDAWASAKPVRSQATGGAAAYGGSSSNGAAQQPLKPQKTGRAEENDGDLFKHSF
ncbi:hypothetical protein JCM9279_001121 [Rhodotorula babjevae]